MKVLKVLTAVLRLVIAGVLLGVNDSILRAQA